MAKPVEKFWCSVVGGDTSEGSSRKLLPLPDRSFLEESLRVPNNSCTLGTIAYYVSAMLKHTWTRF